MLKDKFDREYTYLRFSLTNRCNLACSYCRPAGYKQEIFEEPTLEDIKFILENLTKHGIKKVRFTGGEPTVREDLTEIIKFTRGLPNVELVNLTTNGVNLYENASKWQEAGISYINVSLDSLNADKLKEITCVNYDVLDKIMKGIVETKRIGLKIKINAVLGGSEEDFVSMLKFGEEHKLDIRFIELMETSSTAKYFENNYVSGDIVIAYLLKHGYVEEVKRTKLSGPARIFHKGDQSNFVGVIGAYTSKFCRDCNRIRITPDLQLKTCLFGNELYSFKEYVQNRDSEGFIKFVNDALFIKHKEHKLEMHDVGNTSSLSVTGG